MKVGNWIEAFPSNVLRLGAEQVHLHNDFDMQRFDLRRHARRCIRAVLLQPETQLGALSCTKSSESHKEQRYFGGQNTDILTEIHMGLYFHSWEESLWPAIGQHCRERSFPRLDYYIYNF
jgi:hypothetical protein